MRQERPGLLTRPNEPGAPWENGKFSEMMIDFAAPMLEMDPGGPSDIETLRSVMRLATLCWNVESLEGSTRVQFDQTLEQMPSWVQRVMRQMLEGRKTRFASVPFRILVEVTGTDLDNARIVARTFEPSESELTPQSTARPAKLGGGMVPFDHLFRDLAKAEARTWTVTNRPNVKPGTYILRELYCSEPNCDCRRVLLQVHWVEGQCIAATIGYAFEPAARPVEDEPQIVLDPLNPQTESAGGLLLIFNGTIKTDRAYHDRLVSHYMMWKRVVDDPTHPDHAKVRTVLHDEPSYSPAFPRREPARASAAKVGANEACPCGSGRKYKKCCRQSQPSGPQPS